MLARLFIEEPVLALTSDPAYSTTLIPSLFLVYSVLGEGVSYPMLWGTGPALTSDPVYPTTLIHDSFGLERGY